MMKTYLCGGINSLSDKECNDWRSEAKRLLKTDTLDPMRRDYRGREKDSWREIVENDLDDIVSSDFILVNATRPSWGTAMEVSYAYKYGKTIVCFIGNNDNPSPWLIYHSNYISSTLEMAVEEINNQL
jgi:nucleoside 2-deoxyribosyltransferase